jgi:NAD(P)-dependent dehydrogenase (short-subunit alcohol dehydrogenase family)
MSHTPTILLTGATDGIGRQTAEELAATGANLILHGRSEAKLDAVVSALEALGGHGEIDTILADLSDLDEVRRMAEEVDRMVGPAGLDVLLNNAGVYQHELVTGAQGHELTWVVNYLAPFLLSHLLVPALNRSGPHARIINVSSVAHMRGRLRWHDFDSSQDYAAYAAYAQSKLALVMFTCEFARRLGEAGPRVVSLHPGVVSTKLLTEGFKMQGPDSLGDGAATSIYLALVPDEVLRPNNGRYFARKQVASISPEAKDLAACARLYARTRALVGLEAQE